jgi:hypothetical protein
MGGSGQVSTGSFVAQADMSTCQTRHYLVVSVHKNFPPASKRQSSDLLVKVGTISNEKGHYQLHDNVFEEPMQPTARDNRMDISRLKQIRGQPIEGNCGPKGFPKESEAIKCVWNGEEAVSKAHCDRFGVSFDTFVGNVRG